MVAASSIAATGLRPQRITNTVRMMNGDHALNICPVVYFGSVAAALTAGSPSKRQILAGFQIFKNTVRDTIAANEDRISGSSGPRKLEDHHWRPAKDIPATRQAGRTSIADFQPAINTTNQIGMITDRNGN
ncbi:hypothetical protein SDC9_188196 [bioreactor metagenome]|uniref:Uncharacterized protein n=1 Tax=bioreactor metagenome TaxID=1076179 RepID=A0A645HNR3_9ZZZZ